MSKETPILMSGPMVRAIMENRKTQTRRLLKPQISDCTVSGCSGHWIWKSHHTQLEPLIRLIEKQGPFGGPGDLLWVKETFYKHSLLVWYRADGELTECWKWTPSIFMPRCVSRINLAITNIRVERLQDISDEDAKMEGVDRMNEHMEGFPQARFASLWDSINLKTAPWSTNPYVWVLTFKRV